MPGQANSSCQGVAPSFQTGLVPPALTAPYNYPVTTGNLTPRRRGWRIALDVAIPLVSGVVAVLTFEAANLWPKGVWVLYIGGAAVLLGTVALQIVRAIRADALITTTDDEVNDLRIAMKDSIAPLARLLAEMPNLTPGEKRKQIALVAEKATSVTAYLLLAYIPKVRANVFVLNAAGDSLMHESTNGAGDEPGPFQAGTVAGDLALAMTIAGDLPFIVENTATDLRAGIRRDARYRSFVSVVIRSGDYSYGMLTVDTPEKDMFTSEDTKVSTSVEIAKVVAALLAVGYASAYPGVSAGTSR